MPHDFFLKECAQLGIKLSCAGDYGVGMIFLPPDAAARMKSEQLIESVIQKEGLEFLGWRDVPVSPSALGRDARKVQPVIRQIFVNRGPLVDHSAYLERKLYIVRKSIEHDLHCY